MTFKTYITKKLAEKTSKKRILFIDGIDKRAQEAALLHQKEGIIEPILLFEKTNEAQKIKGVKTIAIEEWKNQESKLIAKYVERRKGKETEEMAKKVIFDKNFFAMLMIELKEVDGVIGGLLAPTADILRSAFKVIGPKPGVKTISSIMIIEKGPEWFIFSDISVNIDPTKEQLVDIAINASEFAKSIDFEAKIAFLSFSTSKSAVHPKSTLIEQATSEFNQKISLPHPAIGEVQFDAAFDPKVRASKFKGKGFEKEASIFIFPDLNAGNIGYKIAQRMGGYGAIGPIITGVNKPVNDLSRGAKTEDVYNTALLTAIQCN